MRTISQDEEAVLPDGSRSTITNGRRERCARESTPIVLPQSSSARGRARDGRLIIKQSLRLGSCRAAAGAAALSCCWAWRCGSVHGKHGTTGQSRRAAFYGRKRSWGVVAAAWQQAALQADWSRGRWQMDSRHASGRHAHWPRRRLRGRGRGVGGFRRKRRSLNAPLRGCQPLG